MEKRSCHRYDRLGVRGPNGVRALRDICSIERALPACCSTIELQIRSSISLGVDCGHDFLRFWVCLVIGAQNLLGLTSST